jgi:DNA (cytosine-5)-methyltransferase 1
MRHGSLFSGIGGFDLAAEWMGWENVFHCEWMEFPRKVLEYHFPNADSLIDICKTDFKKYANKIDILTGGFPCQPFSMAGKRKGTDDERYLWGEMLRAVQEIKPQYVIAENVFGITNIDGGLVFEQVCLDLEAEGYEVQPFIIPAASKNAPHRRDRCWFIAIRNATNAMPLRLQQCKDRAEMGRGQEEICREGNQFANGIKTNGSIQNATDTNCDGLNKCDSNNEKQSSQRGQYAQRDVEPSDDNGNATNTSSRGMEGYGRRSEIGQFQANEFNKNNCKRQYRMDWQKFPTESPICGGDDGVSIKLDGITFSKWRAESIKGYGNAIVPQVAYEIFKQLQPTANCD